MEKRNAVWKRWIAILLVGYLLFLGYLECFWDSVWNCGGQLWPAGQMVFWPFASIRAAARTFKAEGWEEIIGGIVLFIPVGMLLPCVIRRMRQIGWSYLTITALALAAELGRLIFGTGSFVTDTVAGHLIGGMIGYGLYRIGALMWALRSRKRFLRELQEKRSYKESRRQEENRRELDRTARLLPVALVQLPFLAAAVLFAVLFIGYQEQTLGNLNCDYASRVSLAETRITVRTDFSDEKGERGVFSAETYNQTLLGRRAEELFAGLGRMIGQTDQIDEDHIRYRDTKGEVELWMETIGGTYTLTDYSRRKQENDEPIKGAAGARAETIREALWEWKISVPEGGIFEEIGDGVYSFNFENCVSGGKLYSGKLVCDYNVRGEISRVDSQLPECSFYREYSVLSEREAYENLIAGKFYAVGYESGRGIYRLELNGMKLSYSLDSKGYYQPVYRVDAVVNGKETQIDLPAIPVADRR